DLRDSSGSLCLLVPGFHGCGPFPTRWSGRLLCLLPARLVCIRTDARRSAASGGMPAWAVEVYKASATSMESPSGDGARYPDPSWRSNGSTWKPRSTIMSAPTEAPRPKAVLVSVQLSGVTDAEQRSSLKELKRLCETLGFEVVGEVTQKRKGLGAATLLGEGKLVELAAWTGGTGVVPKGPPGKKKATEEDEEEEEDRAAPPAPARESRATVVVIDHELSPRQLRNIERATSAAEVLDRTGVIIEIFHRHASSRPARLQVEIARLTYVAPRLRETGGGERRRGGVGLRGAGESSVELDRRKIRDRISELKTELAAIEDESKTRR